MYAPFCSEHRPTLNLLLTLAGFLGDSVPYIEWILCEGPISLMSVCLPNIFQLGKHLHERGAKKMTKGSSFTDTDISARIRTPGPNASKFVRLDGYISDNVDTVALETLDKGRLTRETYAVGKGSDDTLPDLDVDPNQVRVRNEVDVTVSQRWGAV